MLTDLLSPLIQMSRRFCCFIQRHLLNNISVATNNSWGCLATGPAKNLLKTYTFHMWEDTFIEAFECHVQTKRLDKPDF